MLNLFKNYCEELAQFENPALEMPTDAAERVFERYQRNPETRIQGITDNGQLVGFLITQRPILAGVDLRICEAYVSPWHRGKGLMRQSVKEAVSGDDMLIRMKIFHLNQRAKDFWLPLMDECGFKLVCARPDDEWIGTYFFTNKKYLATD